MERVRLAAAALGSLHCQHIGSGDRMALSGHQIKENKENKGQGNPEIRGRSGLDTQGQRVLWTRSGR